MNNLIQVLQERSALSDTGITFVEKLDKEDFLSYSDLYKVSLDTLASLQAAGLKPGDELIFQLDDNRTFVVAFWACVLGGIVPVPLTVGRTDDHKQKLVNVWGVVNNPHLYTDEANFSRIKEFVSESGNNSLAEEISRRTLVTGKLPRGEAEPRLHSPNPDELAYIQFSSGSTGSPKGVMLTHRNLLCNVEAIAKAARYTPEDSLVSWMPLTHDMGLIGLHLNPIFTGMPQCLIPTALFVRKPAIWLDSATKHKATILGSPNFGYRYLLKHTRLEDQDWELSAVRVIYNGAEPISEQLCHEFLKELASFGLKPTAMCPVYGLAEATLAVTISRMEDTVRSVQVSREVLNVGDKVVPAAENAEDIISFVNVGTPIKYLSVRIGDTEGSEMPEEKVGHLLIKGGSVTSGYFNNPEATNAVMKPGGWLDTGDLGFIKDGCLFVTGRAKDIFFVNGQNYYPHDIERVAEEVEEVELNKIAIGGAYNRETQKEEVIAFVFHRGKIAKFLPLAEEIKMHVNTRTGIELDRVIPVTDIPRTTSGKLQRFRLLQRFKEGQFAEIEKELDTLRTQALIQDTPIEEPATDTERMLLGMWKETLGREEIGVTHRFFTLGGNSLKAAEIGMKLLQETGAELSFATLYEKQTVRELAQIIDHSEKQAFAHLLKAPAAEWHLVAPAQRRLFFAWQANRESTAYNTPFAFELKGEVDKDKLSEGIRQLIAESESLRMVFTLQEGEPVFSIRPQNSFKLSASTREEAGMAEELRSRVQPFDLENGPLLRAHLYTLAEDRHVLFLDMHHIVSDGVSVHRFMSKLLVRYTDQAVSEGTEEITYTDYAYWQNSRLAGDELKDQEKFWMDHLSGELPVLDLPADYSRPAVFDTSGEKLAFAFEKPVADKLRRFAEEQDCSMHALIFACYTLLLSKYTGQAEIMTGLPVAGRRHPDLLDMQGMFVNNLALRSKIDPEESFATYMQRVRMELMQAMEHQDYPFDSLVSKLVSRGDASRNPLFDNMFIYQNMGMPDAPGEGFSMLPYFFDPGFSKFDLSIEVFDYEGSLTYCFEYATALFRRDTITALAGHFNKLVRKALADPEQKLSAINLLSPEEYQAQVVDFNQTGQSYSDNTAVHDLFREQVRNTPDAVAIMHDGGSLSYKELDEASDRLANRLLQEGLSEGDVVGLWLPRSVEYLTAVWAVLKAGACFVPLDKDLPAQRIGYILNDSRCKLLLTTDELLSTAEPETLSGSRVLTTSAWLLAGQPASPPEVKVSAEATAYIIYTSGTTGGPKGVMISHRSLANYTAWAASQYVKGEKVAFPLYSSISFDLTITSVFTPLLTGNAIKVYEESHGLIIEDVIRDNVAGVIKLTPSHLKIVAERLSEEDLLQTSVKRFIVGGEALETHLAEKIHELFGGKVEILNEYGPTEATVGCMIHAYDPSEERAHVPIGKPAANSQIYLLDEYLNPVATGVKGEMYIAGDGLAKGYLHNESLTASKFVDNPFQEGEKMYRTGDMARRLPGGTIEFIGRTDEQVKVNGHRIEPAEIEKTMREHAGIKEAIVLLRENESGNTMLVAYAEPEVAGDAPEESDLRSFLAEKLPYYMVPARFVTIPEWPLTTNGKVDRRALPAPAASGAVTHEEPGDDAAEKLLAIWKSMFGRDDLTVNHNFFELGGDSIKAVQISNRYSEAGYAINVKEILTYQTVAQISPHAEPVGREKVYEQGVVQGEAGSTPISQWFFEQNFTNPHRFHQSFVLTVKEPIDHGLLEDAFNDLVLQHDALRINVDLPGHTMYINNRHLQKRAIIDRHVLAAGETVHDVKDKLLSRFDLGTSLMIDMCLIEESGTPDRLLLTAHHLVVDGLSWRILLQGLHDAYLERKEGRVAAFHKTASVKDWAEALADYTLSEEEKAYWQGMTGEHATVPLETDSPDERSVNAKSCTVSLEADDTAFLLGDAHTAYNTDVPVLLNTALVMTLNEWTGKQHFTVEHENHGRHLEDTDTNRTVGWFTAMYPVSLSLHGDEAGAWIKGVKEQLRQVPRHGLGYGIGRYLKEDHMPELSPAVRFNYLGQLDAEASNELFSFENQDLALDSAPENRMTTWLEWNSVVTDGELMVTLVYNETAHSYDTALSLTESFIAHLKSLLQHIRGEDDIHFTPSDFTGASLDEEDIDALFS